MSAQQKDPDGNILVEPEREVVAMSFTICQNIEQIVSDEFFHLRCFPATTILADKFCCWFPVHISRGFQADESVIKTIV